MYKKYNVSKCQKKKKKLKLFVIFLPIFDSGTAAISEEAMKELV